MNRETLVTPAAGAVLWRYENAREATGGVEVAVVHRPHYDDWSLPKGKLDPGETAPVAAVRELAEETGSEAVLGRFLKRVEYDVADGRKTVDYYSAKALAGVFEPNDEVDELRWLRVDDATRLVSYGSDVEVLRRFLDQPVELTTVLLARHAKAGSRANWTGDDDLRPLSPAGQRQADALRVLVTAFRPDTVFSAPRLRCVQTVRAVADELDVEVSQEPLLSEEGFQDDPGAALAKLREIAGGANTGTALVCSQGGAIPSLVAALAQRDGVTLADAAADRVPSKKGSVWLLSFTADGKLVAAHYLPTPLPAPLVDA